MSYRARSLALAAALALPVTVAAQAVPARPAVADASGAVYTATNAVAGNSVVAYRRATDGSLSFLDSYSTGGRGSGGAGDPLQSQHSLLLSDDHHLLFAANSGSAEISEVAVGNDGTLTVLGAAGTGTGSTPIDIALTANNRFLYSLNAGNGTISGFRVEANGRLTGLGAIPSLPAASGQNGLAAY